MHAGRVFITTAAAMLTVTLAGCNKPSVPDSKAKTDDGKSAKVDDGKGGKSAHSGWWCEEHGIIEEECSMCSAKVAGEFKKKKDWCDKHDRAMSQCFVCNPKRQEFYAAQYRAKYGKEPPPLTEALPKDNDKDKDKPKDKTEK